MKINIKKWANFENHFRIKLNKEEIHLTLRIEISNVELIFG